MKRGFILTELLISIFIFSILALLTFQLASIFITKTKEVKNSANRLQALWFAQDLLSKDLKGMPSIAQVEGGFVGNNGEMDICWKTIGKTLQRKTGKYNLLTGMWVAPKTAVVSQNITQFKVIQKDNGFSCQIATATKTLKFFIARRL